MRNPFRAASPFRRLLERFRPPKSVGINLLRSGDEPTWVDLLFYGWLIAFLLCLVLILQLTPKMMYFVYRDGWDIALDVIFLLLVWTLVCLLGWLANALLKERYRFIVFWTVAVLVAANALAGSHLVRALITGQEGGGPMAARMPEWRVRAMAWMSAGPDVLVSLAAFVLIAASVGLFYLLARRHRRPLLVFAAVTCGLLSLNLVFKSNTRFIHDVPDTELLNRPLAPLVSGSAAAVRPPTVHVILFDSFPYEEEIFSQVKADPRRYPNFAALLSESRVYHQARSAAGSTEETIPQMLTGLRGEPTYDNGQVTIGWDAQKTALSSAPSIFRLAKQAGDSVYITGYFHEYCHLFKAQADGCSDYSLHGDFADFADQRLTSQLAMRWKVMASRFGGLLGPARPPMSGDYPLLYDDGGRFMDPALWASLFKDMVVDYQGFMAANRGPALFYAHLNIPHIPIVFDARGNFIGVSGRPSTAEDYRNELPYIDHVLGILLQDIRQTADFDSSLIVVTADHPFRGDEIQGASYEERHVPVVIKWPHQRQRIDLNQPIDTIRLTDLLTDYYARRQSGRWDGFPDLTVPPEAQEFPDGRPLESDPDARPGQPHPESGGRPPDSERPASPAGLQPSPDAPSGPDLPRPPDGQPAP